jgi:hypothetical protein
LPQRGIITGANLAKLLILGIFLLSSGNRFSLCLEDWPAVPDASAQIDPGYPFAREFWKLGQSL